RTTNGARTNPTAALKRNAVQFASTLRTGFGTVRLLRFPSCIDRQRRDSLHHIAPYGYSTALRASNPSAYPVGEAHSMPRSRTSPRNVSGVNQRLLRCDAKTSIRWATLVRQTSSSSGTYTFGVSRSPSYLGISYSSTRWSRNVFHVSSEISR